MTANTTNTFRQQKIATTESYASALDKLQDQIDSISKNITYLDVYNIIDTVESKDELNVKVAGLINNSSLVINCPTFQEGDEEYATGDIVLKNNNGEVIHIEAQPGGVYYPKNISNSGNNITIQYGYATNTPDAGSEYLEEEETTPPDGPKETMSFPLNITTGDQFIFGEWKEMENITITTDDEDEKIIGKKLSVELLQKGVKDINPYNIQPQVQMWFVTEDKKEPVEQIVCEYKLTRNMPIFTDDTKIYTTQWDIETNDLAIDASIYIKVK